MKHDCTMDMGNYIEWFAAEIHRFRYIKAQDAGHAD